ncbi:hypothetical protein [Novosphingobium sp. B 225]|uniref:hypothetical protein n=1 Tax=Novosphingobium sp. B 225 TaxID=1961849 RepID=UPI001124CD20|nr:hypothetical protein [Novosphingobium sp. B 225]
MSMIRTALAALLALTAAPAFAADDLKTGPIEEKNVLAGKATLDPKLGYVFIQGPIRSQAVLLREPDADTRTRYQADWEEDFAKAQKKYQSAVKAWELDIVVARQTGKKELPEKPVEPTRETFVGRPIALYDQASWGPMFIYSKGEGYFSYLTSVRPGTYIYYGPIFAAPNGALGGLCYCMGSVKFDVKAGQVTDLGNFLSATPEPKEPFDTFTQFQRKYDAERAAKGKEPVFKKPALAWGLPESLKAWPSAQAEFRASGKQNNYYGLQITRIAPIPGVIDYRRDTVIDVKSGTDVANPGITTQVKVKK